MTDLPLVLALDVAGQPGRWINYEQSAYYYAKKLVAWSLSPVDFTLRGGICAATGEQSTLTMNTIIAVRGQTTGKYRRSKQHIPPLNNRALFRRDRNVCAYCSKHFVNARLTRDHVTPRSKGGDDIWTNVVAACGPCNKFKDSMTPEQAGMELVYIPYTPNRAEWLILENRRILVDQMDFLMKQVPRQSRLHLD